MRRNVREIKTKTNKNCVRIGCFLYLSCGNELTKLALDIGRDCRAPIRRDLRECERMHVQNEHKTKIYARYCDALWLSCTHCISCAHNPNGRRATAKCEKANSHTRNIYRLLIFLMFKTNNFIINDRALHNI